MAKFDQSSLKKEERARKIAQRNVSSKTVYEEIEENIVRFFRWISSIIDQVFFNSKYASLFALLLACLAYFVTSYDGTSTAISSAKTLSGVSVNTVYNSESFELSGAPTACDIIITGEAANVNNAAARKGYCQLNLEGYTEGTHTVKLTAMGYGDNVSTTVTPSEATISLKKKTTMQFDLSYDYINQNQMDSRYVLSEPTFTSGTKINIRASQDTLSSIALVKALIDVKGVAGDFSGEAPLVAYDASGEVVSAEIVPSSVEYSIKVTSPSNEVAIKLQPVGTAPNGLAIDTVVITDHQTTRIYGPQSVIDSISEVYVNFDMSSITSSGEVEMMLPVTLPSGVTASEVSVVNVKATLAEVSTITIEEVPLNAINNTSNLGISEIEFKDINVIANGSQKNIENLTASDITVYFEMPSEAGTYDLPLYVKSSNNPYVTFTLEKTTVHVSVVEAN